MMPANHNEVILEAAMAILQGTPEGELNITSLNKALFYLDLHALRDHGKMITGATYLALRQGPVVAKYDKKLVPALQQRGLAVQEDHGVAKPMRVKKRIHEFHHLTERDLDLAAEIAKEAAKHTSARLSEISHDNPGWIIAYDRGLKQKRSPEKIDMFIALQQIVDADPFALQQIEDADPWLTAPPDEEFQRAVNAASSSGGEEW